MRWFRFYSEVLNDPKVQQLSGNDFKAWVNLLCLANEHEPRGQLPLHDAEVGFALRISTMAAGRLIARFVEFGLIDLDPIGRTVTMHGWAGRQFASDDVTLRVTLHRRSRNVTETAPDTEQIQNRTETDPETEQTGALPEGFRYNVDPPIPDDPGFVGKYSRAFERRTGKPCPSSQLVDAAQLERDFGTERCVQVAVDSRWTKPPNWLRAKLENQNDSRPAAPPDPDSIKSRVLSRFDALTASAEKAARA